MRGLDRENVKRNAQKCRRSCSAASLRFCIFALPVFAFAGLADAAPYYWSGDQASSGTLSNPISGSWSSASTSNWYQDSGGTTPYGVNVNPASNSGTQILFGGAVGSSKYTVSGNAASTVGQIVFQDAAAVTDTLDFTVTGSSHITPTSGGGLSSVGFVQNGAAAWNITNSGGASAPIRFNNSSSITGTGSGNLTFSAPFSNNGSSSIGLSVNQTGGAIITFTSAFAGSKIAFTLTNGIVDFQNSTALGNTSTVVSLNGGTLESTTGTALSGSYSGVTIGGNLTFGGPVNWSLGSSAVTLAALRTIVANTGGSSGTTIAGAITGAGGITVDPASTGKITLTSAGDSYGGATSINGGVLFDNGNISASAVAVGAAGTLAGAGTVGLTTTAVSDAGTLAPGSVLNTTGTLNLLGGVAFTGASASYADDVNAAGLSDVLAVTGNIDLGTLTALNVNVVDATSGAPYTIATYTGTLSGTFATMNIPNGYTIDYGTGSNSAITLDLVPEPTSLGLLSLAGLSLLRRGRKSKNA